MGEYPDHITPEREANVDQIIMIFVSTNVVLFADDQQQSGGLVLRRGEYCVCLSP